MVTRGLLLIQPSPRGKGPRDLDATTFDKMFDCLIAVLAAWFSNLASLENVAELLAGELVYKADNVDSLKDALLRFHEKHAELETCQHNARHFTMEVANLKTEIYNIIKAFHEKLSEQVSS